MVATAPHHRAAAPPRLLFATEHIHFPQGGGGAERNTHEVCLRLRARGMACAVLCSLSADASLLSYRNRLRRALRPAIRFPEDRAAGYPVFRGWNEDAVAEVAGRFRPDVAIVQGTHPGRQLRSLAAIGVPSGIYIHEVAEIAHLREFAGNIPFMANSSFTARQLLDQCGIVARIALPLVDPVFYRIAVRPERVLFVNTVPRKGLEIAFGLARGRPDIKFDFVCAWILQPEQRAELARRVRALGNVTLHQPTGNMRALYALTRVLLVPSQWQETWGRVVTEAHINAIPVLSSNTGGLPEAVGPGGLTLDPDAPIEAWLAALSTLWDHPATWERYAAAARHHALREAIRPEVIAGQIADFALHLFAGTAHPSTPDLLAAHEPA